MKALFLLISLFVTATGIADTFILDNQTHYPNGKSRIAIQWAASAKEVEDGNHALVYGSKLKPNTLQGLTQSGELDINIPAKAEYFRVLVWPKEGEDPDFVTNWVDVVPNKTYRLDNEHLVPVILMSGTGC